MASTYLKRGATNFEQLRWFRINIILFVKSRQGSCLVGSKQSNSLYFTSQSLIPSAVSTVTACWFQEVDIERTTVANINVFIMVTTVPRVAETHHLTIHLTT